jgi:hypothetical protein
MKRHFKQVIDRTVETAHELKQWCFIHVSSCPEVQGKGYSVGLGKLLIKRAMQTTAGAMYSYKRWGCKSQLKLDNINIS